MNTVNFIFNSLFVHRVYAASLGDSLNNQLKTLTDASSQNQVITMVTSIAIPLGVIAVVLLLVYGGYVLMTSQGNPDKLQEGKQIITNAIIGFVVVLLCTAILLIISNSLGLSIYY
jgi:hypothetical protein